MRNPFKWLMSRWRAFLLAPSQQSLRRVASYQERTSQLALTLEYRRLARAGYPLPRLSEVGFQAYSQTDEDGILLFLFTVLGTTAKKCVEICAGNGAECNTANLIINHGWQGFLVDGDGDNVQRGLEFFRSFSGINVFLPRFIQAWVTRENINALFTENGFTGEVDLLSLDLDGVDYWIWETIEAISPRVVVLEYQNILGPDRSWTVPYTNDFNARNFPMTGEMPNFAGASLLAFSRLSRRKGYRLIGTNRSGYNAFFVRADLGEHLFPEVTVADCFCNPWATRAMQERFPAVRDLPWVEV
jgi:hypothetical protein